MTKTVRDLCEENGIEVPEKRICEGCGGAYSVKDLKDYVNCCPDGKYYDHIHNGLIDAIQPILDITVGDKLDEGKVKAILNHVATYSVCGTPIEAMAQAVCASLRATKTEGVNEKLIKALEDIRSAAGQFSGDAFDVQYIYGVANRALASVPKERIAVVNQPEPVNENLKKALELAIPFIQIQNEAEGLIEGFGGRKKRPSDEVLEFCNKVLAEEKEKK